MGWDDSCRVSQRIISRIVCIVCTHHACVCAYYYNNNRTYYLVTLAGVLHTHIELLSQDARASLHDRAEFEKNVDLYQIFCTTPLL